VAKQSRTFWIFAGAWMLFILAVLFGNRDAILAMKPNEWGDFLSGFVAPLALAALVYALFLQKDALIGLKLQIELQSKELEEQFKRHSKEMSFEADWRSRLAYHDYFSELPVQHKIDALNEHFSRHGWNPPTLLAALDDKKLLIIQQEHSSFSKGERIKDGEQVCKQSLALVILAYLNDFEEFAAAVLENVVNKEYAYKIEASRVIRAYFCFEGFINWRRGMQLNELKTLNITNPPTKSELYAKLEELAREWVKRKFPDPIITNLISAPNSLLPK
jgi:hypothetical protein